MIGTDAEWRIAAVTDVQSCRDRTVCQLPCKAMSIDRRRLLALHAWQAELAVALDGARRPQPAVVANLDFGPESCQDFAVRCCSTNFRHKQSPSGRKSDPDNYSSCLHIIHYETLSILLNVSMADMGHSTDNRPESDSRRNPHQRIERHAGSFHDPFQDFAARHLASGFEIRVIRLRDFQAFCCGALIPVVVISPRSQARIGWFLVGHVSDSLTHENTLNRYRVSRVLWKYFRSLNLLVNLFQYLIVGVEVRLLSVIQESA